MAAPNNENDATIGNDPPSHEATPDQTLALPDGMEAGVPREDATLFQQQEESSPDNESTLPPNEMAETPVAQNDQTLAQDFIIEETPAPSDQTLAHDSLAREPAAYHDQTIAHDSLAQEPPANHDQTIAHDSLAEGGLFQNDQTLAHDSVADSAPDQTLAHDSVAEAKPDPTLRKSGVYRTAGGVKLSLSSKAGSFVSPGEIQTAVESDEHVPGYEILGELGRGAMGVVYKARQVGLKRVVALKMILSGGRASAAEIVRFRTEAEAVARLQHPYIVQVFEIGEHQGLPYFSLEFVEGGCLADQIAENPLPLRKAAELVRKLAEGMACAHENGIVHRDLKPANVLMTREGDPKITDFGLAKKLEEDSGATRAGAIMGTPSYMAPEQAEGRIDLIGPHSDIYALGAILYDLITGRPPFRGATILETLTQVRSNDPVPPARLHPKMPRDLETITLKCLLKEPKKRYHTARDLAEDLRRFLAGEPIVARPIGTVERTWKWCKRRPTAAALIAVSVVSLLVMAFGGVAYARSEKLRAEEAERLKSEADQQRDRAQEHFRQAREAVDEMLTRVGQEQFGYEPRMEQVRRDLLEKAASFHERFMQMESNDSSVRHGTASSARRVGDARRHLGQIQQAEQAYHRSLDLLEELVKESPDEVTYRQDLAGTCNNLANLLADKGRFAEAETFSDRAIELLRGLADDLPNDSVWRRELASAYLNRATMERDQGKPAPAVLQCRTALNLLQAILKNVDVDPPTQAEAVRVWTLLGQLRAVGDPAEAEQAFREAITLTDKLLALDARNARYREDRMLATLSLGDLLRNSRPNEAGPLIRRAVELGDKLVDDFPTVPDFKLKLAAARNLLGTWQLADGRRAAARESYNRSLAILQRLAENFPRRPEYQRELARSEGNVAQELLSAGLTSDAGPLCQRAIETLRKLGQEFPGNPSDERELALSLFRLAGVNPAAAEQPLREALAIQNRLAKANPQSREILADRAATCSGLGAILLSRSEIQQAEPLLNQAEKDYRDLKNRHPEEPDYRFSLASVRINQGELLRRIPNVEGAEAAIGEAVALLDALAKQYPSQQRFRREQGIALLNLGELLTQTKKTDEAEKVLRQAIALQEALVEQYPDEPVYRQNLAATVSSLAMAQTFRNNLNAAEKNFQRSIDVLARLVEQQPSESAFVRDLARQRQNLARLLFALGRDDETFKQWSQAVEARRGLARQQPEVADFWLELGKEQQQQAQALVEARRWPEARSSFEESAQSLRRALKLVPQNVSILGEISTSLLGAAEACLASKDHATAAKLVDDALRDADEHWPFYPAAAAGLARCAGLATADADLARGYGDRSLELLRKAHANGFKDSAALEKAKEFDALRERDDFKKLLAEMAKR